MYSCACVQDLGCEPARTDVSDYDIAYYEIGGGSHKVGAAGGQKHGSQEVLSGDFNLELGMLEEEEAAEEEEGLWVLVERRVVSGAECVCWVCGCVGGWACGWGQEEEKESGREEEGGCVEFMGFYDGTVLVSQSKRVVAGTHTKGCDRSLSRAFRVQPEWETWETSFPSEQTKALAFRFVQHV